MAKKKKKKKKKKVKKPTRKVNEDWETLKRAFREAGKEREGSRKGEELQEKEMKKLVLMIMVCLVFGGVSQVAVAEKPSGKVLVQFLAFEAEVSQKDFEPFLRSPGETPNLSLIICLPLELVFVGPYVQGYTFKWTYAEDPPQFIFQEGETLFIWLVHSPGKGQNDVIASWDLRTLREAIELTTPGGTSLNIDARIVPLRDREGRK